MKLSQSFVVASLSMAQVGLSAPIPDSPDPNLLSPRPSDNKMSGALSPRMNSRVYSRRTPSPMSLGARKNLVPKASADLKIGGGSGDDEYQPSRRYAPEHLPMHKQHPFNSPNHQNQDNHLGVGVPIQADGHIKNGNYRSQTQRRPGPQRIIHESQSAPRDGSILSTGMNSNIKRRAVSEKRDLSTILSSLSQGDLTTLQTEISQLINSPASGLAQATRSVPIIGGTLSNTVNGLPIHDAVNQLTQPLGALPLVGGPVKGVMDTLLPGTPSTTGQQYANTYDPIGNTLSTLSGTLGGLPVVGGPLSGILSGSSLGSLTNPGGPVSKILNTATDTISGIPVLGGPLSNLLGNSPSSNSNTGASPNAGVLSPASRLVSGAPVVGAPLAGTMNTLGLNHLRAVNPLAGVTKTATSAINGLPVVGGPLANGLGALPLDGLSSGPPVAGAVSAVNGTVDQVPAVGGALSDALSSSPLGKLSKGDALPNLGSMASSTLSGLPLAGAPLSNAVGSLPYDSVTEALPLSLMAVSSDNNSTSTPQHPYNAIPIPDDQASSLAAAGGALPIQPSKSLDGLTLPNYPGGEQRATLPNIDLEESDPTDIDSEPPVPSRDGSTTNQASESPSVVPYVPSAENTPWEKNLNLEAFSTSQGGKETEEQGQEFGNLRASEAVSAEPLNPAPALVPLNVFGKASEIASQPPNATPRENSTEPSSQTSSSILAPSGASTMSPSSTSDPTSSQTPSSSSSAPESTASGSSAKSSLGTYAPIDDSSFNYMDGQTHNSETPRKSASDSDATKTGSGQPAASKSSVLSPVMETAEEHETSPMESNERSTATEPQLQKENGRAMRRWLPKRGQRMDLPNPVKRFLDKIRDPCKEN